MHMDWTVPDICDAQAETVQVAEPLFTDFGGLRKFTGDIVTISCFEDNSLVGRTVRTPGEGRVIVVDGGGSLRRALLGDMLAAAASENGWAGLLINGCVRDVEILKTIPLGVRALKAFPVKTEKLGRGEMNLPIHFAGIDFIPGHKLYADENGVITLPPHAL
jgi:regulator of ribonuclease activity A